MCYIIDECTPYTRKQVDADWWYCWEFARALGLHGRLKIIRASWLYAFVWMSACVHTYTGSRTTQRSTQTTTTVKADLRNIPVVGWGMRQFEFLFLDRNWQADKRRLYRCVPSAVRTASVGSGGMMMAFNPLSPMHIHPILNPPTPPPKPPHAHAQAAGLLRGGRLRGLPPHLPGGDHREHAHLRQVPRLRRGQAAAGAQPPRAPAVRRGCRCIVACVQYGSGHGCRPPSTPTFRLTILPPHPLQNKHQKHSITGFAACLDALSQTGQTPLIYDLTIGYHGYSVRV